MGTAIFESGDVSVKRCFVKKKATDEVGQPCVRVFQWLGLQDGKLQHAEVTFTADEWKAMLTKLVTASINGEAL